MKKLLLILGLVFCLAALCACGKAEEESLPPAENLQALQDRALPSLSREESLRMLRYMSVNRALAAGERLYCLDYDGEYLPVLAEYSLDGGLRRHAVLAENCVPAFLSLYEDKLYYVNQRADNALECFDLKSGERQVLREGPCDWLLIQDGLLYYCGPEGYYYSAEPDGSGETLLLEESCAYPWPMGERILYQSRADERLRLYWPEEGTSVTLTEHAAAAPVIWQDRLYYSAGETPHSTALNGLEAVAYPVPPLVDPAELLPEATGLLLRGVTDDNGLKQWTAYPEDAAGTLRYLDDRSYRLCDYVDEQYRVDAVYNLDGRLRCFLLTDSEGRETVYIAGRVSG